MIRFIIENQTDAEILEAIGNLACRQHSIHEAPVLEAYRKALMEAVEKARSSIGASGLPSDSNRVDGGPGGLPDADLASND